jgi:hypothetical protein
MVGSHYLYLRKTRWIGDIKISLLGTDHNQLPYLVVGGLISELATQIRNRCKIQSM